LMLWLGISLLRPYFRPLAPPPPPEIEKE